MRARRGRQTQPTQTRTGRCRPWVCPRSGRPPACERREREEGRRDMREWVIVVSGGVSLEDQVVNHPQRPDQMVYDMLPAALREQAAYGERPSPAPGPDLSVAVEEGQARRVASGTLVSQSDPA